MSKATEKIFAALKADDARFVAENVASLLHSKMTARLAQERKVVAEALLSEASFKCQECGKTFSRGIPKDGDVECPKCGGLDVELAESLKEDNARETPAVKHDSSGEPLYPVWHEQSKKWVYVSVPPSNNEDYAAAPEHDTKQDAIMGAEKRGDTETVKRLNHDLGESVRLALHEGPWGPCAKCGKDAVSFTGTCSKCGHVAGRSFDAGATVYEPSKQKPVKEDWEGACPKCGDKLWKTGTGRLWCKTCGTYDKKLGEAQVIGTNPVGAREVKNLGWLLQNWQKIESFSVIKDEGGRSDCTLTAATRDGRTYVTSFASANVLWDWLTRPVFVGLSVNWFGTDIKIDKSNRAHAQQIAKGHGFYFEETVREEHMPTVEVQRVFDETGDVAETELLCGIKNLKVDMQGDVVSFVSEAALHPFKITFKSNRNSARELAWTRFAPSWDKARSDAIKALKDAYPDAVMLDVAQTDLHESADPHDPKLNFKLVSAVTEYDRKQEARYRSKGPGFYNIYALSHYLNAVQEAEKEIKQGVPVRKALVNHFNGRLLDVVLKAVGEAPSTREEQR